tara:strand:- start:4926 stop:5936 length:1011 start_codon:yes stop_codon:yes gene_type:complete
MNFKIPNKFLDNKVILVTGGTGSFGKNFVKLIIKKYKGIKKIIIYSRDELKQFEMANSFNHSEINKLRFFLGDVRDKDRLKTALEDVDYVVHAAALKQVPSSEYNPFETIKTNIIGSQNLIESCLDKNIKKVLALSTDKASSPANLYGATKLCADKLFVAANNMVGNKKISFSVLRYGNVFGSRGSVAQTFLDSQKKNLFTITDKEMTRFHITIEQAVNLALWSLNISFGDEIIIPKLPSYRILDLVKSCSPNPKTKIIGIRPGEKIHEELISESDSLNTLEAKDFYLIINNKNLALKKYYKNKFGCKSVAKSFSYTSGRNTKFMTVKELKKLFKF